MGLSVVLTSLQSNLLQNLWSSPLIIALVWAIAKYISMQSEGSCKQSTLQNEVFSLPFRSRNSRSSVACRVLIMSTGLNTTITESSWKKARCNYVIHRVGEKSKEKKLRIRRLGVFSFLVNRSIQKLIAVWQHVELYQNWWSGLSFQKLLKFCHPQAPPPPLYLLDRLQKLLNTILL